MPYQNITDSTQKMVEEMQKFMMQTIAQANVDEILNAVIPKVDEAILKKYGTLPELHEITCNKQKHIIEGVVHEKFDEVLNIVSLGIPVFLTGKAGTGKNVLCKQVAEALGLNFYFTNAVTQEYKLTGFIDANGHYQDTQFYQAFTKGGLFFLDEMDASVPETLIILNAAIANGYFDFPIGRIEAHPDFHVIAAGNTFGTGADSNYTGRFCLDRASLDRFVLVQIDYSPRIEQAMSLNNDELLAFCHEFRKITKESGIECLFSYRAINSIALLEPVLNDLKEVLKISLLKELDEDDINIIGNGFSSEIKNNKYVKALRDIVSEK